MVATIPRTASAVCPASAKAATAQRSAGRVAASGPQGSVQPFTPIADSRVWTPATWAGRQQEFIYTLTADDVAQLEAATAAFTAAANAPGGPGLSAALVGLTAAAFPLPRLGPKLAALADAQLRPGGAGGRGFQLLRGLPMGEWSEVAALVAYLGVAAHMGVHAVRGDGLPH
ncbi:hypothetical protein MNEG_14049 [Monoraphidium neglectum]|uniref:Uncharacterized protein n=1 Tax=Monoraphidium neglectum TaxID=145388 RepID=A0A0D2LQ96_9CHLO|nr:hypothetical protein MNEG_14049 [Monoraphidium neglectum]KIY93914.1 hypothetical protein MNEG_14049 [Monoraphidium neglectum]|eukprot:XP_013892934.1 hypothetical protein MNEG_14049 [Monoraphidium neglectum]